MTRDASQHDNNPAAVPVAIPGEKQNESLAASGAQAGQRVTVLVIDSNEGADVSVHTNTSSAQRGAAQWARDNWACIVDQTDAPDVAPADDEEAARIYFDLMLGDESYSVHMVAIQR